MINEQKKAKFKHMAKFLTPEALEKFKQELGELKNVKRKEISERIRYTAAFGDLKENFAYHEAKEAQGFLEMRIRELEQMINQAKVIEKKTDGKAGLGSKVIISCDGDKDEYQLVESEESDILQGKISITSPIGRELNEKRKGDVVKINTPDGIKEYKVIDVC